MAKNMEKTFNDLITRYILATMKDIRENWEGEDPFPAKFDPAVIEQQKEKAEEILAFQDPSKAKTPKIRFGYENYDNFILAKETRLKLEPVLTIAPEVKQILVRIFDKMIAEIKSIELIDGDTLDSIKQKLIAANAECICKWLIEFGETILPSFGLALRDAGDEQQYFSNKIVGNIPQYKSKPVLTAILFDFFDRFLKALSWVIAKQQWYDSTTVNKKYFLGLLNSRGLDQILIFELDEKKVIKPEKKSSARGKKKVSQPEPEKKEIQPDDEDAIFAVV